MTEVQQPVDYKEMAINALTIVAPPVAIVLRHGKSELDSRHLALSLALYCSFIFYLPSVLHLRGRLYQLLHVRDQGGFKHWGLERLKNAKGTWAKYEPYITERVRPYWQPVLAATEQWHALAKEWQQLIVAKYVQVVALFRAITEHTVEVVNNAWVAYTHGHMVTWIAHKIHVLLEKLVAATEQWHSLARECQQWIMAKYVLVVTLIRTTTQHTLEVVNDALAPYKDGEIVNWIGEKVHVLVEKIAYTISHIPFSPAEAVEISSETHSTATTHNAAPAVQCFSEDL